MKRSLGWMSLILAFIVAACEPESTPIAIIVTPTQTPIPQATIPPPIRYALTATTAGLVQEWDELQQRAIVEQLTDDGMNEATLNTYDIIVTYGLVEGWLVAPRMLRAVLLINTQLSPLNDTFIQDNLRASILPDALVQSLAMQGVQAGVNPATQTSANIRTALANYGYPDGFALRMTGLSLPAQDALINQLQSANFAIDITPTSSVANAHLILAFSGNPDDWAQWEATYGAQNVLHLFDVPISYQLMRDVPITFSNNGLPLPAQEENP